MSSLLGTFIWYDVLTTDTKAAEAFYCKVLGWTAKDSGLNDRSYTIMSMGATGVGGVMPLCQEALDKGARPCWMGYIAVDDVDAYAARVKTAGGTICRAAEDIPGVGRFAVVADPQGAMFMLFRGTTKHDYVAPPPGAPGHIGWHELQASDGEAAFEFYSGLFGWTKAEAFDMGPMGVYQTFATGGAPCGGIMNKMPETPKPFWSFVVNVEAIDAAATRVRAAGGRILLDSQQVPNGSWIAKCLDPQGALFAMVAPRR